MRKLLLILLILVVAAGGAYVAAGFQAAPTVTFSKPGEFAGAAIPIEFEIASADPADVQIAFEQNGTRTAVVSPPSGSSFVKTTVSAASVPGLKVQAGAAKVIVTASRKVWGIRTVASEVTKDVTNRLEQPRV